MAFQEISRTLRHQMIINLLNFFFLNHQFVTWHMEADHGSYFVTTYKRTELHEGEETEKKKRLGKEKTEN